MIFAVQLGAVEGHRHPDIELAAGAEGRKAARKNAEHGERLFVEQNIFADDRGIGAETALPQPIANDRDLIVANLIFFGDEVAAENRLDAKQTEEICGSVDAENLFGFIGAGEVVEPGAPGGKLFEGMVLIAPIEKLSG